MNMDVKQCVREEKQDWRERSKEIPLLQFPSDWLVKLVMPYCDATVRFLAKKNDYAISVYYDDHNALGFMPEPYWEIYPTLEGDTLRFVRGEEREMIEAMELIFENAQAARLKIEIEP